MLVKYTMARQPPSVTLRSELRTDTPAPCLSAGKDDGTLSVSSVMPADTTPVRDAGQPPFRKKRQRLTVVGASVATALSHPPYRAGHPEGAGQCGGGETT